MKGGSLVTSSWHDEMLCRAVDELEGFPAELKLQLRHLLISHHGQYEWGSPRRPKMPEACVLHHADLMDLEVFQVLVRRQTVRVERLEQL